WPIGWTSSAAASWSKARRGRGRPFGSRYRSPARRSRLSRPMRIVIAADNYLVREGARRLLAESGQGEGLAPGGAGQELLAAARRYRPDAVLTDIRMPPYGAANSRSMEGIDAAHAIQAELAGTGVVILSQYADETYAFALFRNGTAGLAYLLKDRIG